MQGCGRLHEISRDAGTSRIKHPLVRATLVELIFVESGTVEKLKTRSYISETFFMY